NAESETENEDYARRAPALIGVLQKELAFYEGVTLTGAIKSMDDTLQISDDTASRVLPYGIAANFALADKNGDMYNDYSYMYRALCRTIRFSEAGIVDEYDMLDGMA
ncbi:MAG: hypothetical protein AAGU77_13840, partial [Bacillota bacterium]